MPSLPTTDLSLLYEDRALEAKDGQGKLSKGSLTPSFWPTYSALAIDDNEIPETENPQFLGASGGPMESRSEKGEVGGGGTPTDDGSAKVSSDVPGAATKVSSAGSGNKGAGPSGDQLPAKLPLTLGSAKVFSSLGLKVLSSAEEKELLVRLEAKKHSPGQAYRAAWPQEET